MLVYDALCVGGGVSLWLGAGCCGLSAGVCCRLASVVDSSWLLSLLLLFAACCLLQFAVGLFAVCWCALDGVNCLSLFVVCCFVCVVCYPLVVGSWLLFVVGVVCCCLLFVACWLMCAVC